MHLDVIIMPFLARVTLYRLHESSVKLLLSASKLVHAFVALKDGGPSPQRFVLSNGPCSF